MAETRLMGADFVRAAACLVVVGHHLSQRMDWNLSLGPMEWMRVFVQMGGFGVAMFFVLSGFLLSRPFWQALDTSGPMPSLRTYALRRGARILPGFWLATTVTFIATITLFGNAPTGTLIWRYIAGMLLIADWHWLTLFPVEINGPLWSISFEVTSYVLLPLGFIGLFLLPARAGNAWITRGLWLLVIAAALLLHILFTRAFPPATVGRGWQYGLVGGAKFWMPDFNPFSFFAMFAVGALAGGIQVQFDRRRNWSFDAMALIALIGVLALLGWQSRQDNTESHGLFEIPYVYPWFEIAVGALLALAPSSVRLGAILDNRATRFVARISFGIYVWHYLVLELVHLWWFPALGQGEMRNPLVFAEACAVVVVISFAIAAMSFYAMEAPVIRWARGLERRADRRAPTLSPAAG
jgi:peptidoglycan/LPS O-acetylase OafA/YrhL